MLVLFMTQAFVHSLISALTSTFSTAPNIVPIMFPSDVTEQPFAVAPIVFLSAYPIPTDPAHEDSESATRMAMSAVLRRIRESRP